MKTTIEEFLRGKVNPEKLIGTIESVMPHLPGNWEMIDMNSKLFFVYKNQGLIEKYLQEAKPQFSREELGISNLLDPASDNKYKRYNEIQAASVALRYYSFESKEFEIED